jgi:hypothetical protein
VEGSLLLVLPQMVWALWLDEEHRAAKMHLAFEVLRGIPVQVRVTEGNAKETDQLRLMVGAERLTVFPLVQMKLSGTLINSVQNKGLQS